MGLFSTVYTDSMTVPDGSTPSTDPTTIGAGTTPQTPTGVRHTDNFDDRVSYEASYYTDVPQAQTILLGNDLDASGTQSLSLWGRVVQALNPTRSANLPPNSQVDAVIQNVGHGGSFSEETWRPYAGLPISGTSDVQRMLDTGIYTTQDVNKEWALLVDQMGMQLPERVRGHPMRESGHPSTGQPNRPWDVEMGAWPWTEHGLAETAPSYCRHLGLRFGRRSSCGTRPVSGGGAGAVEAGGGYCAGEMMGSVLKLAPGGAH